MIWNHQILAFAGYCQEKDSILGEPGNIDLTERIVEFGWVLALVMSRWDFLPLVTMAEDDEIKLPAELRRTV